MKASPSQFRLSWRGSVVGGGVMAVSGLAVGLIALGSARTAPLGGGPGVRLALRVPDALLAAVVGMIFLAAALLLAFIFQGSRRRRRKKGEEEEFQLYYEPPKISPWGIALLLALAVLPVVLLVYTLRVGWGPGLEWPGFVGRPPGGIAGSPPAPSAPLTPSAPERPVVAAPAFGRTVSLLLLVVGVASLGLMLWLWVGDRFARWWGGPGDERPLAVPLLEAVDDSLESLQREHDARRAVILCYRRFERWLADSGVPRAPWETPLEFLRRALGRLPIPPAATGTLTRLFELSRFSHHVLGRADRDTAIGALTTIRAALEALTADAPAA